MKELAMIGSREILGKEVKVYGDFENPLFLAKDVAEWIEHSNHRSMLESVDEDEKGVRIVYTLGGPQESWVLTENGLYEVLFLSRKPIAKEFKQGVKSLLRDLRTGKSGIVDLEGFFTDPDTILTIARNWKADREQLVQARTQIAADAPKVLFADAVSETRGCILIRTMAKILNANGYPTGERRFFKTLRNDGYLCKSGQSRNEPTQRASDMGLFRIKETAISHSDGRVSTMITVKITGRGQVFFVKKYLGKFAEVIDDELFIEDAPVEVEPELCDGGHFRYVCHKPR